jgi:hypothetical protein
MGFNARKKQPTNTSQGLLLYQPVLARPELGGGESGNDELESKENEDDELHIVDKNLDKYERGCGMAYKENFNVEMIT